MFLLSRGCKFSVSLPHGVMDWSVVCDIWYFLTMLTYFEESKIMLEYAKILSYGLLTEFHVHFKWTVYIFSGVCVYDNDFRWPISL